MDALQRTRNEPRRERKRLAAAALPVLVLLAATACGRDQGGGPVSRVADLVQGKLKGRPILRVEKSEFSNADLRAWLKANGAEARGLPGESLSRLFDRFVDERILLEAARERGILVTEDEKRAYLAKLAVGTVPGDGSEDGAALPEGAFGVILLEKYTFLVVRDVRVAPAEIRDYYETHKKDFLQSGRIQVSQILVDSEEKAVSVLRRLERTGEAEFRRIAADESIGPEAAKGGVMGVFQQGDLPADMEKVIFALDEGRTSQVVESAYGFHIFRLDRKFPPALQSEDEAASAIQERITAQKMKEALASHLAGLKDTLSWEARPENLFFAYQKSEE
jgi:hypothetical protein